VIKHLLFFIILVICYNSFAQKQNNQWRFGNGGAIDFNIVPPSFVAGCPISTIEGSASVADRITGALLFYTNGGKVWNANNQVMPNGTGLLGGTALLSSTTAAVIVPKPGTCNLYYIVTVDEIGSNNGVRYSVVDMTLNSGLGDIVPGQKNIFLCQTGKEKLEVVPASDGLSFWLIACSINDEFVSFKIDNAGIQATPVISAVAVLQNTPYPAGHMKINRQFNKIASGSYTGIVVFDFDNATGIVSNPIAWNYNSGGFAYGIEFSPDGKVLYIGDLIAILQYDLTQTTPLAIQNSVYQVTTGANIDANCSLQLGIDEKIYVNSISGSLSAINSPNNLGVACGFQTNVIANQIGGSGLGLPKWIYYANDIPIANSNSIVYSDSCFGNATQFSIQDTSGISSISWNFDDPASGASNTATGFTANHNFSQLGNYNIRTIINTACGTDTLFKTLTITNCDSIEKECKLFFPNAFTPNGDGINDKFYPLTICTFEKYEFLIYNRWGELIFQTSNQTDKWDGKYKGSDCPDGIYVYKITYKVPSQQTKNVFGKITLLDED
jgi:gliding motility-associated-like protein